MTYDGIVLALDERVYHQQPELSSTGAKMILKSPAHFKHYQTSGGETKAEYDVGTLVHSKVLGVGAQVAIYPDGTGPETYEYINDDGDRLVAKTVLAANGALSTKLSKDFAAHARANGLVPMKRVEARVVDRMAESVLSSPIARALFEQDGGNPEVSIFATDPDTGCRIRGRFDYLGAIAVDLKTTSGEASPDGFARSVAKYGYEVQASHYLDAHEFVTGERPRFLHVVVESAAPYLSAVNVLDDDFMNMGAVKARRARELFVECGQTNTWPGYPQVIGMIRPPVFSIYDFQDHYEGDAA